jgi:hypothetical protein
MAGEPSRVDVDQWRAMIPPGKDERPPTDAAIPVELLFTVNDNGSSFSRVCLRPRFL